MTSLVDYDKVFLKDYINVVGIDEVGRGCLAGPVVVCALKPDYHNIIEGVNDSKKLTAKKRKELAQQIIASCLDYVIIEKANQEIDELNIYQATKLAMNEAATKIIKANELILVDAMPLNQDLRHQAIIKGDATSYAIACASIVAKVYRDELMVELAKKYPGYDLEHNKGYGTKKHLAGLKAQGYCEIHRHSFEPIKSMVNVQLTLF